MRRHASGGPAGPFPPDAFADWAAAALPRLDQPFVDFYEAYDRYRTDLVAWQAGVTTPRLTVDTAVLRADPTRAPTRLAHR